MFLDTFRGCWCVSSLFRVHSFTRAVGGMYVRQDRGKGPSCRTASSLSVGAAGQVLVLLLFVVYYNPSVFVPFQGHLFSFEGLDGVDGFFPIRRC